MNPICGRIAYVNDAFTQLTGYQRHELEATELGRILLSSICEKNPGDASALQSPAETILDIKSLPCKSSAIEAEIRLSPIVDRGEDRGRHVVAVLRNTSERNRAAEAHARSEIVASMNTDLQHEIVERRRVEQQLSHVASHDALTGLPNRTLFKGHIERAIASCHSGAKTQSAIAFIDLDHFKTVNDSLGHLMGDALLVGVARRLQGAMRKQDIVARFAGDEFTVLLNDVRNETEAASVVERLALAFNEPFLLGGTEVFATASIGASMIRAAHSTAEEALRDADVAMFSAKENGRARAQFFDQRLSDHFAAVTQIQTSLFGALQRNEFRLMYQPIVSLSSPGNCLQGFEATRALEVEWRRTSARSIHTGRGRDWVDHPSGRVDPQRSLRSDRRLAPELRRSLRSDADRKR